MELPKYVQDYIHRNYFFDELLKDYGSEYNKVLMKYFACYIVYKYPFL